MKTTNLRIVTSLIVILAVLFGLIFSEGIGTLCALGYKAISSVCPLGGLETMIASGTISTSVIVGLLIFVLLILVFGRFFCGWICPVSLLKLLSGNNHNPENIQGPRSCASCLGTVSQKKAAEDSDNNSKAKKVAENMPYIVLGGTLLSTAIFSIPVFCLICPVGLFFATVVGLWQLFTFNDLSWSLPIFAGILIFEVYFCRRWCHKFCPLGAVFSLVARFSPFWRPTVKKESCLQLAHGMNCNKCRKACPENINLQGTLSAGILSRCLKCHQCADVCPTQAISFPFLTKKIREQKDSKKLIHVSPVSNTPTTSTKRLPRNVSLTEKLVRQEASRCIQCGACTEVCPMHNPISQWLARASEGRFIQAGSLLFKPGSMPELCARLCPQEKLCESACPLVKIDGAVPIGRLSEFVCDNYLKKGRLSAHHRRPGKHRVAVIGAGPCGMAFASAGVEQGLQITVFDDHDKVGGLLQSAVPEFKLNKELLKKRQALMEKSGVTFEWNTKVGEQQNFHELLQNFDAVFISTGASQPRMPHLEGIEYPLVRDALGFLETSDDGSLKGKQVVVLGGGDTAMDAARTAIRRGAATVRCIYRGERKAMKAAEKEKQLAQEEGIQFLCNLDVYEFKTRGSGIEICLLNKTTNQKESVICDTALIAWGLKAVRVPWLESEGVIYREDRTIEINEKAQTANSKIFAGGDAVRGPSLAVNCISDGRQAAGFVAEYLTSKRN